MLVRRINIVRSIFYAQMRITYSSDDTNICNLLYTTTTVLIGILDIFGHTYLEVRDNILVGNKNESFKSHKCTNRRRGKRILVKLKSL